MGRVLSLKLKNMHLKDCCMHTSCVAILTYYLSTKKGQVSLIWYNFIIYPQIGPKYLSNIDI